MVSHDDTLNSNIVTSVFQLKVNSTFVFFVVSVFVCALLSLCWLFESRYNYRCTLGIF